MERVILLLILALGLSSAYAQSEVKNGNAYTVELSAPVTPLLAKQLVEQINAIDPSAKADFDNSYSLLIVDSEHQVGIAQITSTIEKAGIHIDKIKMHPPTSTKSSWNVAISVSEN